MTRLSQEEGAQLRLVPLTGETKTELPTGPSRGQFLAPGVAEGVFKRERGTQWERVEGSVLQKPPDGELLGWGWCGTQRVQPSHTRLLGTDWVLALALGVGVCP